MRHLLNCASITWGLRWTRASLLLVPFGLLACNQASPPSPSDGESGETEDEDGDSDSTSPDEDTETDVPDDTPDDTSDTGDDTTDTTDTEPGDAFDDTLYPLTDGARWTYIAKNNSGQILGMEIVEATEVEWQGGLAWVLADNPNDSGEWTESVIVRNGPVAARVHKQIESQLGTQSIVDYDPGFMRADDTWDTVGWVEELLYERTETDGMGQNPDVEARGHQFTVLAVDESVTVPAGTFNCVEIERVRTVGANAGERVLFWYALGVGKVREERLAESRVEELAAVSIPGGVDLP